MSKRTRIILIVVGIILLIIIGIVIYVKFFAPTVIGGTKNAAGSATPTAAQQACPNATNTNTGAASAQLPAATTQAQQAGISIGASNPPQTTNTVISNNVILIGANVYAGQSTTNVYDSCDFTKNKILNTFNTGDFIGTYLGNDGSCIQLSLNVYTNAAGDVADVVTFGLASFFTGGNTTGGQSSWKTVQTGTTNGYLATTASIYFKNPVQAGGYVQVAPVDVNGCDSNGYDVNGNACQSLF